MAMDGDIELPWFRGETHPDPSQRLIDSRPPPAPLSPCPSGFSATPLRRAPVLPSVADVDTLEYASGGEYRKRAGNGSGSLL